MKRATREAAAELTDSLDFLIRDTRLRLYHALEGRLAARGIPLRLWFPLRVLHKNEGITQRELGQILGFGDAHAGVIVGVMHRRKLIHRQPGRVDKRRINLSLTPEGRKMAQVTLREMRAINARIVAGFSTEEAHRLHELLLRAHDNLESVV